MVNKIQILQPINENEIINIDFINIKQIEDFAFEIELNQNLNDGNIFIAQNIKNKITVTEFKVREKENNKIIIIPKF